MIEDNDYEDQDRPSFKLPLTTSVTDGRILKLDGAIGGLHTAVKQLEVFKDHTCKTENREVKMEKLREAASRLGLGMVKDHTENREVKMEKLREAARRLGLNMEEKRSAMTSTIESLVTESEPPTDEDCRSIIPMTRSPSSAFLTMSPKTMQMGFRLRAVYVQEPGSVEDKVVALWMTFETRRCLMKDSGCSELSLDGLPDTLKSKLCEFGSRVYTPTGLLESDFITYVFAWYVSLMPKARRSKGGDQILSKVECPFEEWRRLACGGEKGFILVLVLLCWWRTIQWQSSGRILYQDMLYDVAWALESVVDVMERQAMVDIGKRKHVKFSD